jgi:hypothetical protein
MATTRRAAGKRGRDDGGLQRSGPQFPPLTAAFAAELAAEFDVCVASLQRSSAAQQAPLEARWRAGVPDRDAARRNMDAKWAHTLKLDLDAAILFLNLAEDAKRAMVRRVRALLDKPRRCSTNLALLRAGDREFRRVSLLVSESLRPALTEERDAHRLRVEAILAFHQLLRRCDDSPLAQWAAVPAGDDLRVDVGPAVPALLERHYRDRVREWIAAVDALSPAWLAAQMRGRRKQKDTEVAEMRRGFLRGFHSHQDSSRLISFARDGRW